MNFIWNKLNATNYLIIVMIFPTLNWAEEKMPNIKCFFAWQMMDYFFYELSGAFFCGSLKQIKVESINIKVNWNCMHRNKNKKNKK